MKIRYLAVWLHVFHNLDYLVLDITPTGTHKVLSTLRQYLYWRRGCNCPWVLCRKAIKEVEEETVSYNCK